MKGFCSYHDWRIRHDRAEAALAEIMVTRPNGFCALSVQAWVEDWAYGEVGLDALANWSREYPYHPAMRLADAILAHGKRRGLVRFDRSKRLWVRASQMPADAHQPAQAVTTPGKYRERLTTAEDRG